MSTTPAFDGLASAPQAASATAKPHRRLVTDAPTRVFHALFALSFLGAYLTADGERWRLLHVTLGYTMAGLLAFRVLYGLFGPRHAGLGLLWRKLAGVAPWLRSLRAGLSAVNWRQGQNLLMALAVIALMGLVLPLTLSGYATYNDWGDVFGGDLVAELHEWLGEALLVVVLAHIGLILGLSLLRRKNQALPMLTGRVDGPGPSLVKRNQVWLAGVLLACVLAFWAWQWQQSPAGLVPAGALSGAFSQSDADHPAGHHEAHDDD